MKNEQLTIDKKDESVIEKMKAIQTLNMQRERIDKYIMILHDIEQHKVEILGIGIIMKSNPESVTNGFYLPIDLMEDVIQQMLSYYKGLDVTLIDEAKQLMK